MQVVKFWNTEMTYDTLQKVFSTLWSVCEGSIARNIMTNIKLHAQMGRIIIYYITRTQIANLLRKSSVMWISLWAISRPTS